MDDSNWVPLCRMYSWERWKRGVKFKEIKERNNAESELNELKKVLEQVRFLAYQPKEVRKTVELLKGN